MSDYSKPPKEDALPQAGDKMNADVMPLIGRHFVSQRHNTCVIEHLSDGAIRAKWRLEPTQADIDEFYNFVECVLAVPLNPTVSVGKENEAAAFERWRKRE
jgi:hypothetical protein